MNPFEKYAYAAFVMVTEVEAEGAEVQCDRCGKETSGGSAGV